ncbi:VWA domain-containing protein [Streptomyces sp. CAU 1734]|uniref:VWA domain-containing protein n=1 Tax=Streptomyces sp. CAU 1734 TaxID=3140360 RepID=UPI003261B335
MFKNPFARSDSRPEPAAQSPAPARASVADLTKKAAYSLRKSGHSGQRAAVYLVLDRSGSMRRYYSDGTVQYLAERALGLAQGLDDDGSVPVTFFSTGVDGSVTVRVDDYAGRIERAHNTLGRMGRTNYGTALSTVIEDHQGSGSPAPALIVFQTDGNPDDRAKVVALLEEIAGRDEPVFVAFVAFGKEVDFLHTLVLKADNVSLFQADDPEHIADEELYDGITGKFIPWLLARQQRLT